MPSSSGYSHPVVECNGPRLDAIEEARREGKGSSMRLSMATSAQEVFPHITKNPRVCGGKACIDNTRIRVMDIVQLQREGKKPEEMRNVFAVQLTLAQIYSALAYADGNRAEIEADYARDDEVEAAIERDRAAFFRRQSER
jgi:uncharacterized protein (DUF433 family)